MPSPRNTAFIGAATMFVGAEIAFGFFCGMPSSVSPDRYEIVRIFAIFLLSVIAAIFAHDYVMRSVPPAKPSWALFTIVSLISLIYVVEIGMMWAGHARAVLAPHCRIEFFQNEIRVVYCIDNLNPEEWVRLFTNPPSSSFTKTSFPVWPAILLFAYAPCVWLAFRGRKFIGTPAGMCSVCGYDLRASPIRCPECGTPANGPTPIVNPLANTPSRLTLGGKLTIAHSSLWIAFIFNHYAWNWRIPGDLMLVLALPIGCLPDLEYGSHNMTSLVILAPIFAANSFLWGYGLAAIYRRRLKPRVQPGLKRPRLELFCIYCGHSLRDNISGRCAECGASSTYLTN